MTIITGLIALIIGIAAGYIMRMALAKMKMDSAEQHAKKIINDAQLLVENKKKESMLEVKEVMERERREFEKETRERKQELLGMERRLTQKEENLDRKMDVLERKEKSIADREKNISTKERKLDEELLAVQKTREEQRLLLEKIA